MPTTQTGLPQPVYDCLFGSPLSDPDMAILYLADVLADKFAITTGPHCSAGVLVSVPLTGHHYNGGLSATLTVNRLDRNFTAEARCSTGGIYLPITGSWCDVIQYITYVTWALRPCVT